MKSGIPVLYCLHVLGGSAREWVHVDARLGSAFKFRALDLPGFGDAAQTKGYSVAEMADTIAALIEADAPSRWMIVGHSMGAKVAAAIARRAEDGEPRLAGLIGVITVTGSPPSPEPMDDAMRSTMLGWFHGDAATSRDQAESYIANNSGPQLRAVDRELAVEDVLRANRAAWAAWLEHGSREDWSARIGTLETPALVIAGADDAALGPDAQRNLMAPHFANVHLATIPNAKHLLPLEAAGDLAQLFGDHLRRIEYRALILSNRVGTTTRDALLKRGQPDDTTYHPQALSEAALQTLRAVIACVIPQPLDSHIDLAARLDQQLAASTGDGWRFADLPVDAEAYRRALATLDAAAQLHGGNFVELSTTQQTAMLNAVAEETIHVPSEASLSMLLDAQQMQHWFEDLRGDATTLYVAHPDTRARMGLSGIANGGDGMPKSGFARTGLDEREPWEPIAATDGAR